MEVLQHVTSADGTPIYYRQSGRGRPLVLVHGTTTDHMSWGGASEYLEPHHTVYAVDRRGRGASGDAPDYHILREAEDVAALLEAIGEPADLLGHSFGGLCCLEAALLAGNLRSLILYEPPIPTGRPMIPPGVTDRIRALVARGDLEAAMELCLREAARIPEDELASYRASPLWEMRIPHARTIPRELDSERTYRFEAERFSDLRVPTMLLLGSDSPDMYRKSIEILSVALPDSEVVILPGQQHVAHYLEPELFAGMVTRFLRH